MMNGITIQWLVVLKHKLEEGYRVTKEEWNFLPVSYTHLDVYKRQVLIQSRGLRSMAAELWDYDPAEEHPAYRYRDL